MEWYEVAASVIAALAAFWGLADLNRSRRASEFAQMEEAVSSAAARNDPLEYAYRARLLARLQGLHSDRTGSGFSAALWAFVTMMGLGLLTLMDAAIWWAQVITMMAVFAAGSLSLRSLANYRYGQRHLDADMSDAYERALINARRQFIEAQSILPAPPSAAPLISMPELRDRGVKWWNQTSRRQRQDLVVFATLTALSVVAAIVGQKGVEGGLYSWREAVSWTAWGLIAVTALLPIGSGTLLTLTQRYVRPWPLVVYVGFQVAWIAGWIMWGQPTYNEWIVRLILSDPAATYDTVFLILGMLTWTALMAGYLAWSSRLRRWQNMAPATQQGEAQ